MEKKGFLRSINENVGHIKKNTRQNIIQNFSLHKKQNVINKISNELILYNNPSNNILKLFRN